MKRTPQEIAWEDYPGKHVWFHGDNTVALAADTAKAVEGWRLKNAFKGPLVHVAPEENTRPQRLVRPRGRR